MSELLKTIFGEYTTVQLLGYLWFFLVGYIIYGLTEATGRDVKSPNTPIKWNWRFWFYDNWRRYLTTILCSYILFRFYIEVSGHPFGNFDAVGLGLIGDGIAATLKERVKAIGADRKQLMTEYKAGEVKSGQQDTAIDLKSEQKDTATDLKSEQKVVAVELKGDQQVTASDLKSDQKAVANELKANSKEEQTT
jgi:hypothetical protein